MSPIPAVIGLGFLSGLGLIVAIGAQNAYLLRVGMTTRGKVLLLGVILCAASDALLIVAGVAGIGVIVETAPLALMILRYAGAAFLLTYGTIAAIRAIRPRKRLEDDASPPALRRPLLTLVAFTWLNPHVYLDTVVLLGAVANQQPDALPWWFALGAVLASAVWFALLGFGARLVRPLFVRPSTWRILDALVAMVLLVIGARLLAGL